ncbi:MAG: hypothetical protein JHC95_10435 [Solirubrobacteraceae bacterium]|nr:hypothetical protein [Solirubrobacteraceae bacterium]
MDPSTVLGAAAGCVSSSMSSIAVALQAAEARHVPLDHALRASLLIRLMRRPRWVGGLVLGIVCWPVQVLALLLAPLTVVQPALAFGLVILLAIGARQLGEPVTRRDWVAVGALIGGVGMLAAIGPPQSDEVADPVALAVTLTVIGIVAVLPFAARSRLHGQGLALAAGVAFGWIGISSNLVADALDQGDVVALLAWTVATGVAFGVAMLTQTTALQLRPVTRVVPVVFTMQLVVPVVAAPLVTGEDWSAAPLGAAGILVAVAFTVVATAVLASSPAVAAVEGSAFAGEPPEPAPR